MCLEGITECRIAFRIFGNPTLISSVIQRSHVIHTGLIVPLKLEIITLSIFFSFQFQRCKARGSHRYSTINQKCHHQCKFCASCSSEFSKYECHGNSDHIHRQKQHDVHTRVDSQDRFTERARHACNCIHTIIEQQIGK